MSRAYQIRVSESRVDTVHVEDGVCAPLELLDILPKEQMAELLAAELEKQGFEREGDIMRKVEDDVVIEVDLKEGTVAAKISVEKEVEVSATRTRLVEQESATAAKKRLEDTVQKALDKGVEAEKSKLSEEAADKLERQLVDVRAELDQVVNTVTAEALKAKAASMGEIEEITQDENGSMTIKVRV